MGEEALSIFAGDWQGTDAVVHLIGSELCVVAFSSNDDYEGRGLQFEFDNVLRSMNVSYVLFRDSTRYRHQYGIQGIGCRSDVVEFLSSLSIDYRRLVLTGVSAGGAAAIMYGQLMALAGKDVSNVEVVMVSPYSNLGDPNGAFGPDWQSRGPWKISHMSLLSDLAVIFGDDGPWVKVRAFYSDGVGTEYDVEQARRIGITDLILVPGASHSGLGKLMRDKGYLQKALRGEEVND